MADGFKEMGFSSQESLILSPDTFNYLFNNLVEQGDQVLLGNENLLSTNFLPDDNYNHVDSPPLESLHLPLITTEDSIASSSTVGYVSSALPACNNWPGQFDFSVSFRIQDKNTKGVSWTYSSIIDKLYVNKDALCPIHFSTNTVMPDGTTVRAMAFYSEAKMATKAVHRCYNHYKDDHDKGLPYPDHLIRCESIGAVYEEHEVTERHSVIVPFENPPAGQYFSTYIYKFMCFGSCPGGPNRRKLMLVFTLEKNGQVLGRRKLDMKICACPGRDRESDEKVMGAENRESPIVPERKKESSSTKLSEVFEFTHNVIVPLPKKKKISPNENGFYSIRTRNKDCYDFLVQMKTFYDSCHLLSPKLEQN